MTDEDHTADTVAIVTRIPLWYDGPVLAEMTASGPDGAEMWLLATALPEGAGWSHIVAAPSLKQLAACARKVLNICGLQLDPQTEHYLVSDTDGEFGVGSEIGLTPLYGTPAEDWLCDPGLHVDEVDMFETDRSCAYSLNETLRRDRESEIRTELRGGLRGAWTSLSQPVSR